MNRLRCLLLTLCVIALAIAPMYAQKTTGVLTGVVTDPSGAVVANAPVTVTDTATGATRTVKTDAQGVYSVPELNPTTYRINVKAANYKESVTNGVEVHVASTATVNIKLQLGKITETVEVEANAVQVQTDSAVLGSVVDAQQVAELPLNGRNFMGLTQLAPGVSAGNGYDGVSKGLKGGVDFSVNGNAVTNNLYLVDGANNNDRGSNRTILIYPSIDSIAEFKMLQNSYGPEYGQASGSVITMVTKGGTNQFHGSVFYNGRNDLLDAYDYFARGINTKNKLRINDYGFSVGGPVIKDKLFFFYSQEWNKEIRGVSRSSCVPTLSERAGDFSKDFVNVNGSMRDQCNAAQPINQATGGPLVLASVSKPGQDFINWFPTPNRTLTAGTQGNNWAQSQAAAQDYRQENARVDYNVTKNHVLMGRFTQDNWQNPNSQSFTGWGDSIFPVLNSSWYQPSKMIIGKLTSTIGNSIVNDAEFSYSNNRINILPGGSNPGLLDSFTNDFPSLYPNSMKNSKKGVPNTLWGGFGGYGSNTTFWLQAPWNNQLDMYSVRDDISKVSGSHTFKAGVLLDFNGKEEDTGDAGSERISIGGVANKDNAGNLLPASNVGSGNTLADFMTPGLQFNLNENSVNVRSKAYWRDYEFYFGDTWKARKNLTVELGLRYSLLFTPYQLDNQATSFQPWLYDPTKPASDACNGLWTVPGTDPCGDANKQFGTSWSKAAIGPNKYLENQNYHLFAPRLGLSWDPSGTGNWAIRAGVGQFYNRDHVSPWFEMMNQSPFSVASPNYVRTLDGATPANLLAGTASPTGGRSPTSLVPNSWQWNLAIEHTFAKETALQIAYVGNSAIHQLKSYDINVATYGKSVACPLSNTVYDPTNEAADKNGYVTNPSSFATTAWTCGAYGIGSSYNSLLRPFGHDGQLLYFDQSGHATYHALQMVFKTRYKRSQFTAAYTWSHSVGNVALDDSTGPGTGSLTYLDYHQGTLDRGNTPINRPHIFVANGTYFFPELKGSKGIVRNILGGWELSGITQATSGHSNDITQNVSEDTARFAKDPVTGKLMYTSYGASSIYGLTTGTYTPLLTGSNCNADMKAAQIFDPAAFTLIGQQLGVVNANKAPRYSCLGPHYINTDFSIDKNWKLTERVGMQFRLDFFDMFNHANFNANNLNNGNPVANINCGAAVGGVYQPCSPTNNTITRETKTAEGVFGNSTATVGNHGRELQYGLRITF